MFDAILAEKKSFFSFIGLPEPICATLFVLFLILALSPYFAGKDFGFLKIPDFGDKIGWRMRFVGPTLMIVFFVGLVPIQNFVIAKSVPSYVTEYNASKFEILDEKIEVDAALRQKVSQDAAKKDRVSPVKWTIKSRIRKAGDAPAFFYKDIWTSGLKPDVSCSTHPITFEEIPYEPNFGRAKLSRYGVFIDVSKNPPNQEFDVECTYIFWNGFQNETEDWAVATIKHPTRKLTFTILAPRDKPFKDYKLYLYSTTDAPGLERFMESPNFDFDAGKMVWRVDNPDINKCYRVVWQW